MAKLFILLAATLFIISEASLAQSPSGAVAATPVSKADEGAKGIKHEAGKPKGGDADAKFDADEKGEGKKEGKHHRKTAKSHEHG